MLARPRARSVFINCPFDEAYKKLFDPLVFTIHDCGFIARCGLEIEDSGEPRFQKICQLIRDCPYAIHDISKIEPDPKSGLPRFNMPLELELFLGANEFGRARHKACLVLETKKYQSKKFCSDLGGLDFKAHGDQPKNLVREVSEWFQAQLYQEAELRKSKQVLLLPDGNVIFGRYIRFMKDLPTLCRGNRLNPRSLRFGKYVFLLGGWLEANRDWR